jgi:cellulose synthase (UDP-forming)
VLRVRAELWLPGGRCLQSSTRDVSAHGAAVRLAAKHRVVCGDVVTLMLPHQRGKLALTASVTAATSRGLRVRWVELTGAQQRALVECTLARRDAWSSWSQGRRPDRLLASLVEVLAVGLAGYRSLGVHALHDAARRLEPLLSTLRRMLRRIDKALLHARAELNGLQGLLAGTPAQARPATATKGHA